MSDVKVKQDQELFMPIDERELSPEGKAILDASRDSIAKSWCLGIVGAALGAVLGWFAFGWAYSQGFYALALPGATVGLGFAALTRRPMIAGGIFCAVAAFCLMVLCEWHHRPFASDGSLAYFVTHLHELSSQMTWIFLGLGTVFGFWFGRGR